MEAAAGQPVAVSDDQVGHGLLGAPEPAGQLVPNLRAEEGEVVSARRKFRTCSLLSRSPLGTSRSTSGLITLRTPSSSSRRLRRRAAPRLLGLPALRLAVSQVEVTVLMRVGAILCATNVFLVKFEHWLEW